MFGSCRPVLSQKTDLIKKAVTSWIHGKLFCSHRAWTRFLFAFECLFESCFSGTFFFELCMSKEDPVHYRILLPLDWVLEEAVPMMHWRTCSVIEWSSPIHWWWNTWTQTFHSFQSPSHLQTHLCCSKIFPIACIQIWTGISAFFFKSPGNIHSCFLLSSLPLGMRSPFLNLTLPPPLSFCQPASLKVCMGMLNAQSMQYSRTLLFSIPV